MKNIAIVLAAGTGSRMGTGTKKQFLRLLGKPVMCHSIEVFENSPLIAGIIVVTGEDDVPMVRDEILSPMNLKKLIAVVPGGKERCLSVLNGIKYYGPGDEDTAVLIHDGARPFITPDIIESCVEALERTGGCVVGLPATDTIRLSDGEGYAGETIPRERVWLMQTPQAFRWDVAYEAFKALEGLDNQELKAITDDVTVVSQFRPDQKIEFVKGSKGNIKITTPEDLARFS